jgi:hypothetical protein
MGEACREISGNVQVLRHVIHFMNTELNFEYNS